MLVRMIRVRMRRLLLRSHLLKPKRRRIHGQPGSVASGVVPPLPRPQWESLNQIDLGVRACQLRAMRSAYSQIQAVFRLVQQDVHTGSRTKSPRGNLNDVQVALQLIKVTLKVEAVGDVLVIGGSRTGLGQLLEISLAHPC